MASHESPRIKPGSPADIAAAQAELRAWSARRPLDRGAIASRIIGHLCAAQIGARPNPGIMAMLIEDVERLRAATLEE